MDTEVIVRMMNDWYEFEDKIRAFEQEIKIMKERQKSLKRYLVEEGIKFKDGKPTLEYEPPKIEDAKNVVEKITGIKL